jgi:CubicO group peptidase (beta-lactamase class C family)
MRRSLFTILFLVYTISYCQQNHVNTNSKINSSIEDYIKHLIKRQGIPGVALAIIKNGKTIYKKNFGYANIEHQVPVSNNSIFRLYSLTKPIVSVGLFQLIEKGKVTLEDPISKYIFDLPLSWNTIKIKHLLSHSSGLPDMAPLSDYKDLPEEEAKIKIFEQDLKFTSGEKYDYNQTGFYLIQKIIENVTDKDLATYIRENQFSRNKHTFFSSDSRDIVLHRVTPYFAFDKGTLMIDHSYLQGNYAHSKNGLNITLDEFIDWDTQLREHKLLGKATMDSMWRRFPYSQSNKKFTYGWDNFNVNQHVSYGFTGSLCTAYRIFPKDKLSILFLSNGLSNWYNIDNIINHIISLVDSDIVALNNLAFESLLRTSFENDQVGFFTEFESIKSNPLFKGNNFETHLNDVGYFWLLSLKNAEKAIHIFQLNTKEFPESWNAFDSLAEAHQKNGDYKRAIVNYKKSIHLNSDETYKASTIQKIEKLQK